ncbi:MAG: MFS transporter [Lachnospiraceae bacterium]|nr:MFS transporter [Lachnospiraceae bacterium]
MTEKSENIRYSLLLGCYMMLMCVGFNFNTYYLHERDVTDGNIGILIAVSCLLAVAMQQIFGRLVDSGSLDGKKLLLLLAFCQCLLGTGILLFRPVWAIVLMFGIILCSIQIMQPILNSFSFYYKNEGITVNFGVARGIGSLCFSGCSILLGALTDSFGGHMVPLSLALLSALIFFIILSMPSLKGCNVSDKAKKDPLNSFHLFDHPSFALMLFGLTLVMLFHNMVMTYFIYVIERVGGDSGDMGIAIGIAGLVEIPVLFLYAKIKGNRSSKYFLAISGVAFFAKAVLFIFAGNILMIYFIQLLQCLAFGLMAASRVYYVDETVGKENEATGQAYTSATETIGIVLGSAIGGVIMHVGEIENLLWVGACVCLVGMVMMLVAAFRGKH